MTRAEPTPSTAPGRSGGAYTLPEAPRTQSTAHAEHGEPHAAALPRVVASSLPQLLRGIGLLEGELRLSRARERRGVELVAKLRDFLEAKERTDA